jgi:hypothetical protein
MARLRMLTGHAEHWTREPGCAYTRGASLSCVDVVEQQQSAESPGRVPVTQVRRPRLMCPRLVQRHTVSWSDPARSRSDVDSVACDESAQDAVAAGARWLTVGCLRRVRLLLLANGRDDVVWERVEVLCGVHGDVWRGVEYLEDLP